MDSPCAVQSCRREESDASRIAEKRGVSIFPPRSCLLADQKAETVSPPSHTSDADTEIQCKYSDLMSVINVIPVKPMAAPRLCITSWRAAFSLLHFCAPSLARGKSCRSLRGRRKRRGVSALPLVLLLPLHTCACAHSVRTLTVQSHLVAACY